MTSSLESFFHDSLKLYPSMAAFLGDRSHDTEYENTLSRSHNIRYGHLLSKYKRMELKGSPMERKMMQWVIRDAVEGQKYGTDLMPIDSHSNTIIDFTFLNTQMYPLATDEDIKNLMSRHVIFMEIMRDIQKKMTTGMKRRVVLPKMICSRVIESLEKFIKNKSYVITLPKDLQATETAKMLSFFFERKYQTALKRLLLFLKKEYIPACRDTIGVRFMPGGKSLYKYLVRSLTTLNDMTPEYAHDLGLHEVSRLKQEFEKVKRLLKYPDDMSVEAFITKMLKDPANYHKDKQALFNDFKKTQKYIDQHVIPKNFVMNVKDHEIQRVPVSMEKTSPGAFYYPPSALDGSRPGVFYLNMRNLRECPRYSTMTLSLHEGKPGHHYQFQYMVDAKLPVHKMYSINSTSFVEGWGLYAESLGNYNGKPYDYFGKLTYEMFRAVRLVVDTGIHWYGWSFDKAVNYMMQHLAMSKSEIETEVERYICMPAQALCYKIGELKLQQLRRKWIKKYGDDSESIQTFHQHILEDGVLPLDILESKIKMMIHK